MSCNHVWRDTLLPRAKKSKNDLLNSIIDSGSSGWWLRGEEFIFAHQLFNEGLIKYCENCGPDLAVFYINLKESNHETI